MANYPDPWPSDDWVGSYIYRRVGQRNLATNGWIDILDLAEAISLPLLSASRRLVGEMTPSSQILCLTQRWTADRVKYLCAAFRLGVCKAGTLHAADRRLPLATRNQRGQRV